MVGQLIRLKLRIIWNTVRRQTAVLVTAFTGAVTPMVLRLWADEGEAVTQHFLQRVFHLYLLFAIQMVAGACSPSYSGG